MELPQTFGRYTLLEKLAVGGMAEIYRARYEGEGGFARTVVIKRILPAWGEDPDFIRMLVDEARALAYLQHQNIVQVYELGRHETTHFIAMEFVPGFDCRALQRALRTRALRLPKPFAVFLVSEVLKGLAFAHSRVDADGRPLGIVHRDISPQNVLCSFHGEVKLADFGIAKGAHRHRHTQVAQLKGKYAYMAPEQACGTPVDARADLFAVGVLLYELLSGKRCFDGPNDLAVLERVRHAALDPKWEQEFHPVVRGILRRALAKAPAERYPNAAEFLEGLTGYAMRHRMVVHGLEWADYLQRTFPTEAAAATAQSGVRRVHVEAGSDLEDEHGTKVYTAHPMPPLPRERRVAGIFAGIVLLITVGVRGDQSAPVPITLPTPTPVAVALKPIVPVERKPASAAAERGSLAIQARPWGTVTIPGVVSGRETPVGATLKPGSYLVRVTHEATHRSVTAKATVRSGGKTTCFATFADTATIRCR